MLEKVELLKKKGNISHADMAKLGLGGENIVEEEDNEAEPVPPVMVRGVDRTSVD